MLNLFRKPFLPALCALFLGFGGQDALSPVQSAEPAADDGAKQTDKGVTRIEGSVKPAPKEGLASLYPGDVGIERDPRVIFVENFEHDSLDSLAKRWETVSGRDTMALSADRPTNSAGKQSLQIDRLKGMAGQLYRRLKNSKGGWGYNRVFARYYVKFDPECGEIHHFGTNHLPFDKLQCRKSCSTRAVRFEARI